MVCSRRYRWGDGFESGFIRKHILNTLVAGAGLCDTQAVSNMVYQAPKLINELVDYGVGFTRKGEQLDLGKEGGHSEHRIVHAADATGREVENVLAKRVKNHPNIDCSSIILPWNYSPNIILG